MRYLQEVGGGAGHLDFGLIESGALHPVVTADFMRPPPGMHNANSSMHNVITAKLLNWLQPSLTSVFGTSASMVRWDDEDAGTLPVREIYESHDVDPSTPGWIKLYRASPTPEAVELLRPFFAGTFVIGFELSPYITSALNALSVPYVSLAIHPLRFMADYKFMVASNLEALGGLADIARQKADISFAAQLKRADMLSHRTPDLEDDCAVLFGQVGVDASLIGPKGLVSLQERMPELRALCAGFDKVYFKPHPYAGDVTDQLRVLQQFENVEFVTDNPYALLSSPQVSAVAALTSSILSEAAYFGKKRVPLTDFWRDLADEPAFGIDVLSPMFWDTLLSLARHEHTDPDRIRQIRPLADTRLKTLLNVSWETHGRTDIPETGIELAPGQTVKFGSDNAGDALCVGGGWKQPSQDHRWAGPDGAYLSFRLPSSIMTDLSGTLTVVGMGRKEMPILLQLICKDHVLAEKVMDVSGSTDIQIDFPAALRTSLGEMQIEIRCSHGRGPKFLIGGGDRRTVSVSVYKLRLDMPQNALHFDIGKTIKACDFDAEAPFLEHGWHTPEESGIWTNGNLSRLTIVASTIPETDLVLNLGNVRALMSDLVPLNNLIISVEGKKCRRVAFHRGQPGDLSVRGMDISVPISREAFCTEGRKVHIDFEVVACHSPALAGISSDPRQLGLFFDTFRFDAAITDIARRPSEHIANVFGPFNIHTGLAVMTRNAFASIQEAMSQDVTPAHLKGPRAINFNNSAHFDEDTGFVNPDENGSDINIFNGDVTRIARMVSQNGSDFLNGRYNICYGAWELETMPTYLADTRYIDEYWGLSTFIADAARKRMDVPVHAFPIPVDLHFPETLRSRSSFDIPDEAFVFLFTFSVDSTMARKNPEAVLEAFQQAFPDPQEPAFLVIKSMVRQASKANKAAFQAFKARVARNPRVRLIEETLSRDDNASLYMCSDAFVSLHRAEGFGLTMAEAMGYGKPTIGTGYSGNLDFMTPDNACLVTFDKVEMDPDMYHGQQRMWAEPHIHDAAQHMRRVYDDILFREKIARAGKRTIYEDFSKLSVGRKLLERINDIREARG
jgi:glycosyltransferase involved in cell wall biosynthesis